MLYTLFMMGTHGRQRLNKLYRQFKNIEKPTGIALSVIFCLLVKLYKKMPLFFTLKIIKSY